MEILLVAATLENWTMCSLTLRLAAFYAAVALATSWPPLLPHSSSCFFSRSINSPSFLSHAWESYAAIAFSKSTGRFSLDSFFGKGWSGWGRRIVLWWWWWSLWMIVPYVALLSRANVSNPVSASLVGSSSDVCPVKDCNAFPSAEAVSTTWVQ